MYDLGEGSAAITVNGMGDVNSAAAEAPVVLLLHGSRTSSVMWRAQTEQLDRAGIRWVAPDLPGHGSRREERFSLARTVEVLDEEVEGVDAPVVVAGLSLGGYLAIHWAATTARPVAGVLAASCSTLPRGVGLQVYRLLAAGVARLPDRGRWLNDTMAGVTLGQDTAAELIGAEPSLEVMTDILAEVAALDVEEELRSLGPVPVRLVNGRWDHFRGDERRLLAACEAGRLVIVPGAHHLVSFVRPVAFARALLELVAEASVVAAGGAEER